MEIKYDYSLYEACEDVLYDVVLDISTNYNGSEVISEIYYFLNSNNSKYEAKFSDYLCYNFEGNKDVYKKIMKLIIASNCYQYNVCELEKGKAEEDELPNLMLLEEKSISSKSLLAVFENPLYKGMANSLIEDFLDFFDATYIYRLDSMNDILKTNRLNRLLKINPFAILEFVYMVSDDKLISSERTIQNYIDTYDKCAIKMIKESELDDEDFFDSEDEIDEEEKFMMEFLDELRDIYKSEEDFEKSILYIISNVYENMRVYAEEEANSKKWIDFFEKGKYTVKQLKEAFITDQEFFGTILNLFLRFNDNLFDGALQYNRERFQEVKGNVKVLKKLNPFFEEEKIVYDSEKTVN